MDAGIPRVYGLDTSLRDALPVSERGSDFKADATAASWAVVLPERLSAIKHIAMFPIHKWLSSPGAWNMLLAAFDGGGDSHG